MKRGELGVNLLFGFEKRSEKRFGGFGDVLFALYGNVGSARPDCGKALFGKAPQMGGGQAPSPLMSD